MLADIQTYVNSRTGVSDRTTFLREVNKAWRFIWDGTDLPGSLWTLQVRPVDGTALISLPYFVQELRMARMTKGPRVDIYYPTQFFQDASWFQSPLEWQRLGETPLTRQITNGAPLRLTLSKPEDVDITVTVICKTATADRVRDQITIAAGDLTGVMAESPIDVYSISKPSLTSGDIRFYQGDGLEVAILPNSRFEASNQLFRIRNSSCSTYDTTRCFEVLYKSIAPYLYYDEDTVPRQYESVLADKTVSNILATQVGKEDMAQNFGLAAAGQLSLLAASELQGTEVPIDLAKNQYTTTYYGRF